MFSIRGNFDSIRSIARQINQYAKNEAMKVASSIVIKDVRENTKAGRTGDGESFRPYKPSYAKERQKLNLQTEHIDLTVTGKMLESLHYDADGSLVTVDDENVDKATGLHYGNSKVKPVPFMDAGLKTSEKIEKEIIKDLEAFRA